MVIMKVMVMMKLMLKLVVAVVVVVELVVELVELVVVKVFLHQSLVLVFLRPPLPLRLLRRRLQWLQRVPRHRRRCRVHCCGLFSPWNRQPLQPSQLLRRTLQLHTSNCCCPEKNG